MADSFNRRFGYMDMPLCDSHIHITNRMRLSDTEKVLSTCADLFGIERLALLALPHSDVPARDDPSNNAKALFLKTRLGARLGRDRVYAFGGLSHCFDARDTAAALEQRLAGLIDMGFDGLKTLMGKPPMRRRLARPLCDPVFDGVWSLCEKRRFPVTMHLGDPGHWWLPGQDGRPAAYGMDYLTLECQRAEVEKILDRHPGLDLLLCHFYFIADDLEGARAFLERHSNVLLDITPGGEMFYHFSKRADEWRDFFRRYSRRILFGSDTDNWTVPETLEDYIPWFRYPYKLVKDSMERHGPFEDHDWGTLDPVDPGADALKDIYHDNFIRRMGEPKPVDTYGLLHEAEAQLSSYYSRYDDAKGDKDRWDTDRLNLANIAAVLKSQL